MNEADEAEIEASKAPLIEHLMELRERLIKALLAFLATFVLSFFFAKDIYNLLLIPYTQVAGPEARLIYTAPQEYFFTQIKVALFMAAFLSCPIVLSQIYAFVAPGLYKHERTGVPALSFRDADLLRLRRARRLFSGDAQSAAFLHGDAAGE